jgi:hypothetical protein
MIRTRDPLLPKQMLYQAELRPDTGPHVQLSQSQVKASGVKSARDAFQCTGSPANSG